MSEKSFKTVKTKLLECNKLPEPIKDIIKITSNNSLKDLDGNNFNQLWILTHDFVKEMTLVDNITQDEELLLCYQSILNLVNYTVTCADEDIIGAYEQNYLFKTILVFQTFYSTNLKYKFKLDIAKMCCSFWQLITSSPTQNGSDNINLDLILTQNFVFTFNYIFDTIKVTTKKMDMKVLSTLLWEFCKVVSTLSSNINGLNLIVPNLKKLMKCPLFLETETGKLAIADIFTCSQQLFHKFHQTVKQNLPKAKKLEAESYGEIYFISWINSNSSIREVIEEQMFDLISKTLTLKRTGLAFCTYRNALILLQSLQNHRKHLMFSKVITKLYAPVIWRQLTSEFSVIRCNATDILARAYPLEKRGEGREVSSRFLIKQQNAFLDLLVDVCPQVRIAAIKGICSCMRYFWNSFEDDQIIECFKIFIRLIDESIFEVRRVLFYGFCQLLEEFKSHSYFRNPFLITKMKNTFHDENEKVRRAFIHLLLKIKKIDSQSDTKDKINFTKIVDLRDIASALAREDKQNGFLLVDLIFDNFIGSKVADRHTTLTRFYTFYKINPNAFRKLIIYSEKHLDFHNACKLILSLLKTIYNALKKKEERLKNLDKENDMPPKRHKSNDDSDLTNDTHNSSCSSSISNNEDEEQNESNNICCVLDCVHCLMILHRNEFKNEKDHQQLKDIQDSSVICLIKIFKFYKEGDAYYSAVSLASLMPLSKLSAHVSITSTALSTLKQLPYDINQAEEEIDMRKVSCLVYSLCMWKRGYEILQFVNVWFDEAFKTLNLNETQYPDSKIDRGKRVRFKINFDECKPLTGILLINTMLTNLQTQKNTYRF
uniref:Condensin-2 complex subunit G2 n=1 Tax=Melanaphis sacchari TaxID=742174 RepID=A0A2H8TZZ4_9HEMI